MLAKMQAAPHSNIAEFTVSELSSAIKRTVEDAFGLVRLRGEISGYRGPHSSGHVYLALKDERARIDAVIWRGVFSNLKFKPEEGLEVIVTGRVTTFPGKSSYQIVIEQLEPAGAGALMALLEERKKRFAAEGLFDEARKRPLPFWPQVIGIVTSPTGAVIRDMLHGFDERCPAHAIVWPVRVQGETCAAEVAAAIRGFNALSSAGPVQRPDLLIVARGGGSLEDLWGFNEEAVVRAAAESAIPLISAVGHETDWTLIDLVADARAPTPTKAAEWAVPKHSDLVLRVSEIIGRVRRSALRQLEALRAGLKGAERGLPRPQKLLAIPRQRIDAAGTRLALSLRHFSERSRGRFERCAVRLTPRLIALPLERSAERLARAHESAFRAFRLNTAKKRDHLSSRSDRLHPGLLGGPAARQRERLHTLAARAEQGIRNMLIRKASQAGSLSQLLRTLSHKSVLERGFALIRDANGLVVRRASAVKAPARLDIEFADGHVEADVSGETPGDERTLAERKRIAASRRSLSAKKDDGSQGSLL
jgi:exodeoxyribonuclease VII large subunit